MSSASSFENLSSIEKKMLITLQAWAPRDKAYTHDSWMGVVFLSGKQQLLAPLKEVAGILPVPALASIPGVKSWCRGLGTYRNIIFPVTDMGDFFTQEITAVDRNARIILIKYHADYFGLLVNGVMGLEHISSHEVVEKAVVMENIPSAYAPFISQGCTTTQGQFPIFQCHKMVEHPDFQDVI